MGIVIGVLLLSGLVFVHELGHFLAAKRAGVRVETFAIGFGPRLFGFRRGDTDYCVCAILFGGYVKMTGQEDVSAPDERTGDSGDFRNKPVLSRIGIALAGPVFNYLLAVAVLVFLYATGIREPADSGSVVTGYVTDSSSAAEAGLKIGDTLLTLAGARVSKWEDAVMEFAMHPERPMELNVAGEGGRRTVTLVPRKEGREGMGVTGLYPAERVVVGAVFDSTPAFLAGVRAGDTVLALNGRNIPAWDYFTDRVKEAESTAITLTLGRADGRLEVSLAPRYSAEQKRYLIGIQKGEVLVERRYPFPAAVGKAFRHTGRDALFIWKALKGLVSARVSVKSMTGPVGIVHFSGQMAKGGLDVFLLFLAMISVNLAVVNLFPFLVISDGGVIFFLLIEKIRGRPLSAKRQMAIQQAAFFSIIALFVLITFNDISRLIGR